VLIAEIRKLRESIEKSHSSNKANKKKLIVYVFLKFKGRDRQTNRDKETQTNMQQRENEEKGTSSRNFLSAFL
jgi:hypothetical protein